MGTRRRLQFGIMALAATIALVIGTASTALGAGASSPPFQITKVTPQNYIIISNGPAVSFTINWTGTAASVTAYIIPAENCSTPGVFMCGSHSQRFARATHTLVWRDVTHCSGVKHPYTGHDFIYLVSKNDRYTDAIPLRFTCKP
jgi:hypothetical protein